MRSPPDLGRTEAPTPDRTGEHAGALERPSGKAARAPVVEVKMHELSPWTMFLAADVIVKAVICSLLFASLVTWTIFFAKAGELFAARRNLRLALAHIAQTRTLADAQERLGKERCAMRALVSAAALEVSLSSEAGVCDDAGTKERAASVLAEITRDEGRTIRRGMGLLATIGSTAPFVGLFGTVWGIMNSFIGISSAQTTNLAVVAPGIAEALLATAVGLVAAIPAVIFYNHFSRQTRAHLHLVAQASGAVDRLISRELDRRRAHMLPRAGE